jgi:LysM repeat protein
MASWIGSGLAAVVRADDNSVTHVVQRGETLSGIARIYYGDARMQDRIQAANRLEKADRIREGQKLLVPMTNRPAASVSGTNPVAPAAERPAGDSPPAVVAQSVQSPAASLAVLDGEKIRSLAAEAIRGKYPELNLSEFDRGHVVYVAHPTDESRNRIIVDWLGRAALELEKGSAPELDRKKVRKLEVLMTSGGRVLDISDQAIWLNRSSLAVPTP